MPGVHKCKEKISSIEFFVGVYLSTWSSFSLYKESNYHSLLLTALLACWVHAEVCGLQIPDQRPNLSLMLGDIMRQCVSEVAVNRCVGERKCIEVHSATYMLTVTVIYRKQNVVLCVLGVHENTCCA